MTSGPIPEIPPSFLNGYYTGYAQYEELQAGYNVAIENMVGLAFRHGSSPENTQNAAVLYTLDGNIGDAGGHDDYAHRLLVHFQAAPKRASSADAPETALTKQIYYPTKTAEDIRSQIPFGAYATAISLQRSIPMRNLGPHATRFDARNETQLVHTSADGNETRYSVDPKGGTLEIIPQLPHFESLVESAYGKTVQQTARLVLNKSILTSFEQATDQDAKNPHGVVDNIKRYNNESRHIPDVRSRIKNLVKAIASCTDDLSAELARQLMVPDISNIAAVAVLDSSSYYDKDRGHMSFDQRLLWIAEHADTFHMALRTFIETQSVEFGTTLEEELRPVHHIVLAATAAATDTQPPKAIYPNGDWKIARAL